MTKSLGDYNKEKSSSSDLKNIKWSKKNIPNTEKPKNKNKKKISPTNNLPTIKNKNLDEIIKRVFKVETNSDEEKTQNKTNGKKFQKSSASNCKIEPSFKRRGR